jgi:hypothetical protein
MVTKSMTMLSVVLISLCVNTAASTIQASPILKILASDDGSNNLAGLLYIKPALAFQTNFLPLGANNNYYFYLHSYPYPSTSTRTIANTLIEGWTGRCLSTATTAAAPPLSTKIGSTTNPLFSVLPGNVVDSNRYCNQYLQSDLNQNNKMNLFSQCVPSTQWRNFIASINNKFSLGPYCNSVIGTTRFPPAVERQEEQQTNEATGQSTGPNFRCINGQCQTSSPSTIGEPSGSSISQQTTCINNVCQTMTCINGQCQTSSPGTTATTIVGEQGREVNQGQNIIGQQRVNQQASCAFGPGKTASSCVNSPISLNNINEGSNRIFTAYNNMPFLLAFP